MYCIQFFSLSCVVLCCMQFLCTTIRAILSVHHTDIGVQTAECSMLSFVVEAHVTAYIA